ncbi:hypothetical protein E3N88_45221 [Mikania micrantha]|uniref:Lycopene beta-cyclase n=1 Tax=Mikania micrantha TaxID=192012 RepID=A0A5N6L9W8_9ASTR|nr:hypothetical protein E3N88_45221 [Mikania micrantha]
MKYRKLVHLETSTSLPFFLSQAIPHASLPVSIIQSLKTMNSFITPLPQSQFQESGFLPKKSHFRLGQKYCVKASSSALLELVPEIKKENLDFELPMYDPTRGLVVDLVVVGGGPSGLAVAQQVSEAGLTVCTIDPSPKLIWPNNYGVWVDEFEAMDLLDCLDTTWSSAVVYIDENIEEDERCVIPMGGPLPVLPQRVLGIGGTAGMVHPSTGYMVARTLAAAPIVAKSIIRYLVNEKSASGDDLSAGIWRELWPIERRRQREFFCFGMDILLKLDLEGTRRFFDAFFDLEPRYWHGFLSSRLFLPELVTFGLSLFGHASNTCRIEIMAKGTLPLATMIGNLVKDRE